MELKVINSNSLGNAYILRASNGEALLIECGVRFELIKKAVNFNLRSIVGCIVTHEHGDHCKAVNDVLKAGITVWASKGTHDAMGTSGHHRSYVVASNGISYPIILGTGFKVKAFNTKHDCAEPVGYLIHHAECGTVLFLTDSYYCEYNFTGLNNIIIEANYCQKILDQRMRDGENPAFLRDRVIQSHMSLDTCKRTLQTYDLSNVLNIVLIHLSPRNSDEIRFKREVQEATGKIVTIATPGLTIPFNTKPF